MLCGCTSPAVERRETSTNPNVDALGHRFDDGRRLVVPSPPNSPIRHCLSVRVRPSSETTAVARGPAVENAKSDESLGLGAEARRRTRSYTLTDGATSAIGRILTCFQDTEANSDDFPRSRPRARSLWSRRRSPVSCVSANSSGVVGGCVVDVILDCSPGTVRRRRLETQSVASTSSTLQSDAAWNTGAATSQGFDASSELTATSSERLFHHPDQPVWERRQLPRGKRRVTEPVWQRPPPGAQPQGSPATDIPPPRDSSYTSVTQHGRSRPLSTPRTASDSTPPRRRVTRRATTCAIPHPQVRVVQLASSGGGQQVKNEKESSAKLTTPCQVS